MAGNMGNKKVELEGKGPLTLRQSDYLTSGGEAAIWHPNGSDLIVKIYIDPAKMVKDGIPQKVKLLQPFGNKIVLAPQGIVTEKGSPIGIYMPFADGGIPLPQVFTNAFRTANNFGDNDAKVICRDMRDTMIVAHGEGAVLGDANELNWLAVGIQSPTGPEVRAIDVDSWSIGQYPTTVCMPSIKDYHTKGINAKSDWFAWAVVTFEVFIGIHPYRGTLPGYASRDWEKRMQEGKSIFEPGVRLNASVRDFSTIPPLLLEWYRAVFVDNVRTVPPSPFDKGGIGAIAPAARIMRTVITAASGSLVFEKVFESLGDGIIKVFCCGVVETESGNIFELSTKRRVWSYHGSSCEIVSVKDGWLIAVKNDVNTPSTFLFVDNRSLTVTPLQFALNGRQVVRYENRMFVVTDSELVELNLMQLQKPLLVVGTRTAILSPKSVTWFDGLGVQEAFGAKFLIMMFGEKSCITVRVKELDGITPLAAKSGNRFCSVVGLDKGGSFVKFELTFDEGYQSYKIWKGSADGPELNVSILPKGVCATIINDNELVIFVPSNGKVVKVNDKQITTNLVLANWNDTVVYVHDGAVWSIKMK